jgi:hypothetical protein
MVKSLRQTLFLAILICCAGIPANAQATQAVKLHVAFTPERLGQGTTVDLGFQIVVPADKVPPPLTQMDMRLPGNLGIALSGLGLATCSLEALEVFGGGGCPANSRMGYGTALSEVAFGPQIISETDYIGIFRAPTQDGHLALLFYVYAAIPVTAQAVLSGLLLPTPAPFGGSINVSVPLEPSLPGAPNVALVRLRSTLGPKHITYYEQVHGKTLAYHPRGILLPNSCPHGGFPFVAEFTFEDDSHTTSRSNVPCPTH